MQGKRTSLITFFLSLLAVALLAGRSLAAAEYKIMPGDSLNVTVVGETEYSKPYKVSDDGKVMLPHVGYIPVSGRTVQEATKDIEKRLAIILKKPIVLVDVTSYVRIVGEVKNANPMVLQPEAKLSTYLRQASVSDDTADLKKGYIIRAGQKDPIAIDLKAVLDATDASKDIVIEPGDTIYVPKKDKVDDEELTVFIYGEVAKTEQNGFKLKTKMTPLQAITAFAGGFKSSADKTRVTVQHKDSSVLMVDLDAIERGEGDPSARALLLQDGDVITVPNNEASKIDIQGLGVKVAKKLDYKPGMTVYEAIRSAGNPTDDKRNFVDDANKEEVAVTRKDGQVIKVDLAKYEREGDMLQNVTLQPGDTVFVGVAASATTNDVEVVGDGVKTPGRVPYESGMRVMDAINKAGSFLENAKKNQVNIIHKDGSAQKVDLNKYLNNGDMKQNVPLQKGDTILVATQKPKDNSNKNNWLSTLLPTLGTALLYGVIYK